MAVGKTKRLSTTRRKNIVAAFRGAVTQGTKVRLYSLPGVSRKLVVHSISDFGAQQLFTAIEKPSGITFEHVGYANPGFTHREVFGSDVRRKGLASKMLRAHEAIERKAGADASIINADKKSVLLFLLNHGYHIDAKSQMKLARQGVRTQKELTDFVTRVGKADVLPFGVQMVRPLKKR